MSEIRLGDIPISLINYVYLIKDRRSPYYDVVQHVFKEMEMHYKRSEEQDSEIVYTINPRVLHDEIEKKVNE